MEKEKIAIFDSGVGGLSVLKILNESLYKKQFLYFGDNENAPYGNKDLNELKKLISFNINYINTYNPKCIVIACNTLSVTLLSYIKQIANCKVFGLFQPVLKEIYNNNNVLFLSTNNTAKEYCKLFSFYKKIKIIGLNNLAKDIENNVNSLEKIDLKYELRNSICYCGNDILDYNSIILGCTHYNFIKKEIFNHFNILNNPSGENYLVLEVKKYLKIKNHLGNTGENDICFIGKCAKINEYFYKKVVTDS